MQSLALAGGKDEIESLLDRVIAFDPHFLLLFAAPSLLQDESIKRLISFKLEGRQFIGCSTAGEISAQGHLANTLSILAMRFDATEVRTATATVSSSAQSTQAGGQLAESLKGPKLQGVIVFTPGIGVNGDHIVEGIVSSLGRQISLSGGLAGDETAFKSTQTICNGDFYTDRLVAVGFYGDAIVLSTGSEGGWRTFGPARRVTKSVDNVLYELDNKPALQLYKQYLGEKARQLPASGLAYPFALLRDDRTTSGLIRSALNIDHENEALVMAGNVPEGAKVCLMHADVFALTQGAAQAAAEALRTHDGPEENGCALLVSCVGRRMVLGIDVDDEVEAVVDSFLPGTPLAGFYAYGEICSAGTLGKAELHNQTMTITYITERRG
ncbi:MAG: FIST N-terminal domain-containing protein [Alphaproteobacteria bacterium]|nr:FIST N-terminal domain-containing protein [Alphaproteobacteria bacterium]